MGRRSNEQICIDLRKERGKLYARRSRATIKLQNKKLQGENRKKIEEHWENTQKRLDEIKAHLFRCGKKYSKFKSQRTKLRRHQRYLKNKVDTLTLSKKQLNLTYKEMRRTAEMINRVENSMLLPVGKMKTGLTGFLAVKGGKFKTDEVLWALAEMFKKWVHSADFAILVLDDEIIDIANDPIVAQIKVDQAIQQAMSEYLDSLTEQELDNIIPTGVGAHLKKTPGQVFIDHMGVARIGLWKLAVSEEKFVLRYYINPASLEQSVFFTLIADLVRDVEGWRISSLDTLSDWR